MAISLDEVMNELSTDRHQKIEARTQPLTAAEQVRPDLESIVKIRRKL